MSIQIVLFDAVGTLIYPDPPVTEAYEAAGRRHGSSLDAVEIARRTRLAVSRWQRGEIRDDFGQTVDGASTQFDRPPTNHARERQRWREVVAEVFDDVPDARGALFESLWSHFASPENWRLYDDVAETWRRLRPSFRLGVASNFDDRLEPICRHFEPLRGCPHLFWSARIGYPKPSPHFFARVERQLHTPSEAILLVGDDRTNDYLGALRAGWASVYLDRSDEASSDNHIASLHGLHISRA
ncbi:MAG: HAD hydrolase-like protein [Pirellulaceae bacterium]